MLFCTITHKDHIASSMVLARSIKQYHHDAKVVVCLIERKIHPAARSFRYFDEVVLASDIGISDFNTAIQSYSAVESVSFVKAQFIKYVMERYVYENIFIYVEPQTKVLGPFKEFLATLDENSIVFTPFYLEPPSPEIEELRVLRDGNLNGNFFGLKRSAEAISFIQWWCQQTQQYYDDAYRELTIDEMGMNFSLMCFDIHIFKHPCYQLTIWNLNEKNRKLCMTSDGRFLVNKDLLRSCLFVQLPLIVQWCMKREDEASKAMFILQKAYRRELEELDHGAFIKLSWDFAPIRSTVT